MFSLKELSIENITTGKFETEFPEFYILKHVIENNGGHINDQVFGHCIRTAEKLSELLLTAPTTVNKILEEKIANYSRKDLLIFTAFLHDIGKQIIHADTNGAFTGHEQAGADLIKNNTLKKTDINPEGQEHIIKIVKNHGILHELSNDKINILPRFQVINKKYRSISLELLLLVLADLMASDLTTLNPNLYQFKISFFNQILTKESYG